MKLGRLEKVNLRKYWQKEDRDFTPWLAKEENIQLLGETIGLELEVQEQEKSIGPFKADIFCLDTTNEDNHVLIENQLEKTDHTHLGQLMTYGAGLDALTIVWIAQRFTEEHRAALDWLNRITDEEFNFFGIEIELYKIGESAMAPLFKLVSKPNGWFKSIKSTAKSSKVTHTKLLQRDYWAAMSDYFEQSNTFLKSQKPLLQHWTNLAIGRSHFHLSASVNSRLDVIVIWLNIGGPNAKMHFDKLYDLHHKDSLENLNPNLNWERLDDKKMCYVGLTTEGDFAEKSDWNRQHEWFRENLEAFTKYFKEKIKSL